MYYRTANKPPGSVGTPAEFETDSVCTGRVYVICNAHTTGPRIFLPGKFVRQPRLNRPSLYASRVCTRPRLNRPSLYRPSLYPAEIKPAELLISSLRQNDPPQSSHLLKWTPTIFSLGQDDPPQSPHLPNDPPQSPHPPLTTPYGPLTQLRPLIKF